MRRETRKARRVAKAVCGVLDRCKTTLTTRSSMWNVSRYLFASIQQRYEQVIGDKDHKLSELKCELSIKDSEVGYNWCNRSLDSRPSLLRRMGPTRNSRRWQFLCLMNSFRTVCWLRQTQEGRCRDHRWVRWQDEGERTKGAPHRTRIQESCWER